MRKALSSIAVVVLLLLSGAAAADASLHPKATYLAGPTVIGSGGLPHFLRANDTCFGGGCPPPHLGKSPMDHIWDRHTHLR